MNPNYRKKCYYKFWDREGFSLAERALYFVSWLKTHDHVGSANKHIQEQVTTCSVNKDPFLLHVLQDPRPQVSLTEL